MIYISAQPDEVYFLWQLELQIFNFQTWGIPPEHIHVLVSYQSNKGLNPDFKRFFSECHDACFFAYPDTRLRKKYLSSLRPHIIAKHFRAHPELEEETLFYHDSDILFCKKPDWQTLLEDDCWYASDTRSYLDSNYIKTNAGRGEFLRMCEILSIDPKLVEENNNSAGGAQYILKHCTATFWEKIEHDCEKLFSYLYYRQKFMTHISPDFQIWCTDMWAMWWNAILGGRCFKIHPLMDFCWANSPVEELKRKVILHYTGSCRTNELIFDKTKFQTHAPFYCDLSGIGMESCSTFVIDVILKYRKMLDAKRKRIDNTIFVVLANEKEIQWERKAIITRQYFLRYWDVPVEIVAGKTERDVAIERKYSNCWVIPSGLIIPITELESVISELEQYPVDRVLIYKVKVAKVDSLGALVFSSLLDIRYLEENIGKTILMKQLAELHLYSGESINNQNLVDKMLRAYEL